MVQLSNSSDHSCSMSVRVPTKCVGFRQKHGCCNKKKLKQLSGLRPLGVRAIYSQSTICFLEVLPRAGYWTFHRGNLSDLRPQELRNINQTPCVHEASEVTSVLYETSSKTHMSKSAKRAFRTRLPPKVKRKRPSEHTRHAVLPSSFAIPAAPNNTRSHANPNVTATFTSTTTHNLTIPCACHASFRVHTSNAHKVLRLPRNVTSVTPRNLTIPCPCHENRTSTLQNPHKVLRLPRKVTISSHVSFNKICTTPHVWNDFEPF